MAKTRMEKIAWTGEHTVPGEYKECVQSALRRMAIVLNSGAGRPCSSSWLKKSDTEIATIFAKRKLDTPLVNFFMPERYEASESDVPTSFDQAENLFYGNFDFRKPRGGIGTRVTFNTTAAFLDWSYERLHWPDGTIKELGVREFADDSVFLQACASNYLLKNFWHNYTHKSLQGINELNYGDFGGEARFASDFEADNVATILLAYSYGFSLTSSRKRRISKQDPIRTLLSRNKCNLLFFRREEMRALKAGKSKVDREIFENERAAAKKDIGRFAENEWYLRRKICNLVSAKLVTYGLIARQLSVFFTGSIKRGRNEYYRKGEVVVCINGQYFYSGLAVYVIDPMTANANQRRTQNQRCEDITASVVADYEAKIRKCRKLRDYSGQALQALIDRVTAI